MITRMYCCPDRSSFSQHVGGLGGNVLNIFASTWLHEILWLGCGLGRWPGLNPVDKRIICFYYFSEKEPSGDLGISG